MHSPVHDALLVAVCKRGQHVRRDAAQVDSIHGHMPGVSKLGEVLAEVTGVEVQDETD